MPWEPGAKRQRRQQIFYSPNFLIAIYHLNNFKELTYIFPCPRAYKLWWCHPINSIVNLAFPCSITKESYGQIGGATGQLEGRAFHQYNKKTNKK